MSDHQGGNQVGSFFLHALFINERIPTRWAPPVTHGVMTPINGLLNG